MKKKLMLVTDRYINPEQKKKNNSRRGHKR